MARPCTKPWWMNSPIPTISGYKMTLKILRGNLTLMCGAWTVGLFSPPKKLPTWTIWRTRNTGWKKSWKNCAPFAPLYEWAMVQQQRRPLLWMKPPPLIWRPFVSRLRRRRSPHTTSVFPRTMTCIQVEQRPNIKTMSWRSSCSSRLNWKSGQRHQKNKSSLPAMSDGAGLPTLSPVRPLVGRTNIRS